MRWIANGHSVFGNGQSFARRVLETHTICFTGSKRVKYRCAVCGALRRAWAGQAEDGITDRNQSAAFTLHGTFSNSPQTEQEHPLPGVYS